MTKQVGYWVDLSSVQLSEGETPSSWIMAMTEGKYDHPVYGEIDFNSDRLKRFADSVVNHVRGIDPDVDYDHKKRTDEAAGWVKNAKVENNSLWLFVEWTSEAAKKIRDKAYRYFSPEFLDEWQHPKSGATFQDVLNGGALTNRPFLKDLAPVNLSEFGLAEHPKEEGEEMREQLIKLLKLSDSASDADIEAAVKKLQETPPPPVVDPPKDDDPIKKLAEDNPIVAKLLADQEAMQKQFAEMQKANKLMEVTGNIKTLHEFATQKGRALPPAINEDLLKVLVSAPKELSDGFMTVLNKIAETGTVELGERGSAGGGNTGGDPIKAFNDEVKKAQDERKLSYVDAVATVSSEKPQMYAEYAEASYAGQL